ncbi:cytochrome p450 alkane [Ophiostoma piceae UAMH 11346]|uniref:Cytochrome p450 alkane n=1 Tax=Ophiostoma piceae (strain UAMH 11346) TaxID=1262450 RepID=S3C3L3_OPHP1|nr:cytochrome p450 alkane [Ophiostoma piceae UAMH 11346]
MTLFPLFGEAVLSSMGLGLAGEQVAAVTGKPISRESVFAKAFNIGQGHLTRRAGSPVIVRKDEGVGYCVYAMHGRKGIYREEASVFRPERWEGDDLKDIGWGYLPFNRDYSFLNILYCMPLQ